MTKREIDQNLQDVQYAVAQQRLEGLTVSAATIKDMERCARGEISMAECLDRVIQRHKHVDQIRE